MPFGLWSKSSSGVSSASSSSGSQHHHRHHASKTHRHERSKSYSASASSSEEAAGKVKTVVESSEHEDAEDDAVLARIDPKAKTGSTLVDSDSDGCYEKEYLDSLKHKSNRASYVGGAATGVAAAVGTFVVFASPLAVAGAAAVGAGGAWKLLRDKGKREVKAAEGTMKSGDHSADVTQTMLGASGTDLPSKSYFTISGKSATELDEFLAGGKPSLKRLKFLVSWARLQVEDSLPSMEMALNSGDSARISAQCTKLMTALDEVIGSFSPWVQQQYVARAEKDKGKRHREFTLICLHVSPLYKFLAHDSVNKAFLFCNTEFLQQWENDEVSTELMIQRCRSTFPTIVETVGLIRSHPSKRGRADSDLMTRSEQGEHRITATVFWISQFLRRSDVQEFMSSAMISGSRVLSPRRHAKSGVAKISSSPLVEQSGISQKVADTKMEPKAPEGSEEDEDGSPTIEFPPIGAELEMDEDEFYSASEGECSDNEDDKALTSSKVLRKRLERVERRPPSGLGLEVYGAVTRDSVMNDKFRPFLSTDEDAINTWNELDCTKFKVRGHTYLSDKVKHPSEPALMKTVAFELFFCDDEEVFCCSTEPHCKAYWLQRDHPDRFFFTVTWRMAPFYCTNTFMVDKDAPWLQADTETSYGILMRRFLEMDDEDRNGRVKVIPAVAEGPWIVKKAVGQTPAIIGRKLTTTHFTGDNYVEVSVDVFSSAAARHMMSLVVGAAKKLVIDVGFVLEGHSEEELPERLLGGFRLRKPDLATCRRFKRSACESPRNSTLE
ncbi:conserved hypothetical protein [Perkinsus marinus ATCC 50983]|uniref:Protein ENHANCED DISEASE RESISTANCE 2 C-terminal domain-containing protein n=1 Tax=Perkinsus marinus (strain ATCC 50983 / TXsc) TaxID=423536 RepID=C5L572_PERM5|nr:conserved hypothetical protein [Perkinsus marinus ATCC 50983]EER08131.1 conserved hypothetical protein [Perkinsus marinus ATCC 50983]|eukprot:XP_002776315.1 conserved hypothetical protein [Perkinsus marinus ATCC 50983]